MTKSASPDRGDFRGHSDGTKWLRRQAIRSMKLLLSDLLDRAVGGPSKGNNPNHNLLAEPESNGYSVQVVTLKYIKAITKQGSDMRHIFSLDEKVAVGHNRISLEISTRNVD